MKGKSIKVYELYERNSSRCVFALSQETAREKSPFTSIDWEGWANVWCSPEEIKELQSGNLLWAD